MTNQMSNTENDKADLKERFYWRKWYAAVILMLVAEVIFFYWLTKYFS